MALAGYRLPDLDNSSVCGGLHNTWPVAVTHSGNIKSLPDSKTIEADGHVFLAFVATAVGSWEFKGK